MSVDIETLRRDPQIVDVAQALGVPLDEYVMMVAQFVSDPDAEPKLTLSEDQLDPNVVAEQIAAVEAWIEDRLRLAPEDSFSRVVRTPDFW